MKITKRSIQSLMMSEDQLACQQGMHIHFREPGSAEALRHKGRENNQRPSHERGLTCLPRGAAEVQVLTVASAEVN